MKRKQKIIIGGILIYMLLLVALLAAESKAEGATIVSFWDAIWFSVVTLTTVGYGDLSPVTPAGRILGIIFVLCSVGVLSALISLVLSMFSGQFVPRMRLRSSGNKPWYVFAAWGRDSATLARQLQSNHLEAVQVFLSGDSPESQSLDISEEVNGSVSLRASVEDLLRLRKDQSGKGLSLLFMGESEWENMTGAAKAAELLGSFPEMEIYCMAQSGADPLKGLPLSVHLFSREECVSRCYWKDHPLTRGQHCIVLLGCGKTGAELLSRALLINVLDRDTMIEYHVFDDTSGFEDTHPEIMKVMSAGGEGSLREDTLTFHSGNWQAYSELLERADRIILCGDDEEENLKTYELLRKWFVTGPCIHVFLSSSLANVSAFGKSEDVITEEFVMKGTLNRKAVMLNDIYNEGTDSRTSFAELSDFNRQSNIAAADHMPVKVRWLLGDDTIRSAGEEECRRAYEVFCKADAQEKDHMQEIEHRRWMRFLQLYNWKYSPVRNNAKRHHPLLVPYEDLSDTDKAKDSYAWELLGRFAGK